MNQTKLLAPLLGALLLAACGSSSDPEPTAALTGSVYAAPVAGASVVARDAAGAAVSAVAATAADGTFTVQVPESKLAGPLFLEATGGTFTDEATEASTDGGPLLAYAAGPLAAGASLHLTPQSTIVARMVQHGATLTAANGAFEAAFGFPTDPTVKPANVPPTGTPPVASELAAAQAAFRAGAFSQLAEDLAIPAASQFELFQALARDAADGSLDGKDGATKLSVGTVELPVDVQNRFSAALMTWQANTTGNQTALKVDQIGAPPFAKKALTASYVVDYVPMTEPLVVGKNRFRVQVTTQDGAPVAGLALGLMPKMHMTTKSHACPTDPVVDLGGGLYEATIYYVMSTTLADGTTSQGVWELGVSTGGMAAEKATFYPKVGWGSFPKLFGNVWDTVQAKVIPTDLIFMPPATAGMAGMATVRTYQLFSEGLTLSGDVGTFRVLITTMDTMMTFPHIMDGVTLLKPAPFTPPAGPTAAEPWVVAAVLVEMSSDGTTWQPATHQGNGHYSATNLAGLVAGTPATIRVRLTVDGVAKTTQNPSPPPSPASTLLDYATFTVTPAAAP